MKRLLLSMALSVVAGITLQAEDNHLYIQPNAGETTGWSIPSLQKMSFKDGHIVLTTKTGTTSSTPIPSISRMYITTPSAQGIGHTKRELPYRWDGEKLHVEARPGTMVEVFNISGSIVTRQALAGTTVDLHHLSKGIYIVKIEGKAFRIIKK